MAVSLRQRTNQEFGNLPHAGDHSPIQVPNYFGTNDATGTPQTSPLAYSNSVIPLVVPQGAVHLSLLPTTDLRVSEQANAAQYDLIKAGSKELIACAEMANIYIIRDSADGTLYFKFIFV